MFYVNLRKCFFGRPRVPFLGHKISAQGAKVEAKKVEAVQEWPIPKNAKELHGFLGLSRYK